ncbi:MAG TPA: hypothetical protein VHQ21_03640 [Rhodanobacteraceae bacterium]|jgi:hypothetical protein|nr:hypothetical protein [Rhodanobacteraceae bacterium]
MNQIRNILSFLLIAGTACVHAQQPIVKINGGSQATGCDVSAAAGAPIFQLDATGNVLVNGSIVGTGCGPITGGGTNTPTFGLNPAPQALVINGGASVQAGTVASVPLTYLAYYASSCSVGTPTTSGTCPAISASNAGCSGTGSPLSCSPANGTVSVPTAAAMGTNTTCTYSATANCGGVTSTASLAVTAAPVVGGGDIPPACASLATIHTSAGAAWTRLTTATSVRYGDGTVDPSVDPTSYVAIWQGSYPGTLTPWPGTQNGQAQPNVNQQQFLSEKFTVALTDAGLSSRWAWTGSGNGTNFSTTISMCPGDFGQTGTQLTVGCKTNQGQSSSGLTAYVNAAQQGTACTLTPGNTYYLNILPNANLPVNNVSTPSSPVCSGGICKPWTKRI